LKKAMMYLYTTNDKCGTHKLKQNRHATNIVTVNIAFNIN